MLSPNYCPMFYGHKLYLIDYNGAISTIRTCGPKHGAKESNCFRDRQDPNKAYCYCGEGMCNTDVMSNVTNYSYKDEIGDKSTTYEPIIATQNNSKPQNDYKCIKLIWVILLTLSLMNFYDISLYLYS